jgi:hypothetical protein
LQKEFESLFPRDLFTVEKNILFFLLPENKPGYLDYRNKIDNLKVIGEGRFGNTNLILGSEGTLPDLLSPSMPIFASGKIYCGNFEIDILLHEEIDNEIEFDISSSSGELPAALNNYTGWNYSEWIPGDLSPGDNEFVREVPVKNKKLLLAIVPSHKKLWLHNYETGINHLIPVTNFYNQLMITVNEKSFSRYKNQNLLFEELNNFTNEMLLIAFLSYAKYMRRFNLNYEEILGGHGKRFS